MHGESRSLHRDDGAQGIRKRPTESNRLPRLLSRSHYAAVLAQCDGRGGVFEGGATAGGPRGSVDGRVSAEKKFLVGGDDSASADGFETGQGLPGGWGPRPNHRPRGEARRQEWRAKTSRGKQGAGSRCEECGTSVERSCTGRDWK